MDCISERIDLTSDVADWTEVVEGTGVRVDGGVQYALKFLCGVQL